MKFFLLVFLICFPIFSESQSIQLLEDSDQYNLGTKVEYLIDKENRITIDNILEPENQKLFIKNNSNIPEFGYMENPIWLKFTIQDNNTLPENWFLEIGYPLLDNIELYTKEVETWKMKKAGDVLPFLSREIYYRHFIFVLSFPKSQQKTYYIKITSTSAFIIPIKLYKEKIFSKNISYTEAWHFIYYGVLLVMIFYNGFISISLRSLSYLLYSLSTLSMLAYQVMFNGHGFQYLWQENIWLQKYGGLISIIFFAIFTFEFMNRFLDLKKPIRYSIRIFLVIQNLMVFTALFYSLSLAFKIVGMVGIINIVCVISTGIISWIKGYRPARFFVIAWGGYCLGAILVSLRILGLIGTNFITTYALQIGSMVELVFLSIALADRYNLIMDENINVQKELLESQIVHTNTLEEKVKERTATLDNTLSQLNQSLKLIHEDLTLAKKIQKNTLLIKPSLLNELRIVQTYLPMTEVGGDFYDITKISDSSYRIFQADATGHGVQAAMITMAIKGIYDNVKNYDLETAQVMEIFNNDYMNKYQSLNSFMTAIIVDIDVSRHRLKYTSAGHPAALLIHNSEIQLLKNTGKMIGIVKNIKYNSIEYEFSPGDRLYIFTDGIFEEFNSIEEEFGEERLYTILRNNNHLPAESTIELTLRELDFFLAGTPKQDDITILAIEHKT